VISQVLFSQTKTKLIIKESDSLNNIISKSKSFKDSVSINNYLENKLSKLISQGYISASIDSVSYGDTSIAYLHKGIKYTWGKVEFSKEFELIENNQIKKSTIPNNNLSVQDIETKIEKTINYFENNGYPFCTIKLENVNYTDANVDCKINLIKNKIIKIDSIIVKGDAKISVKYLEKYLEIKTSDLYNEKKN
jgi:outer membrane protein assembly factor BamA